MPPTPLQSWLIAFSIYPIGDRSVVYVTIGCCLTTLGGFQLFLVLWCVCVYHMQLSHAAIGSSGWVTKKPRNGWQNIISGAGAGRLAGFSWHARAHSCSDFQLVGQLSLKFRLSHIPMSSSGSGHPWKARGAVSCVCLVAPLQGLVGA